MTTCITCNRPLNSGGHGNGRNLRCLICITAARMATWQAPEPTDYDDATLEAARPAQLKCNGTWQRQGQGQRHKRVTR